MDIYTAQYGYDGDDRLDVTVKGNDMFGINFAPNWDMVNRFKNGLMSEKEYELRYRTLMNSRYGENKYTFTELVEGLVFKDRVTLVCFCPPGAFCHRILLAEYLAQIGATYKGERNFDNVPDTVDVHGSILDISKGIICQQTNCKGVMGAGFAKAIADKWPIVKTAHKVACNVGGVFGTTQVVTVEKNLYVANIFGQNAYGRNKRYTDYRELRKALIHLKEWRDVNRTLFGSEIPIYFPHGMSCSLAGGDWYLVRSMIKNVMPEAQITKRHSGGPHV